MTVRHPPRAGNLLLERLGPQNDALIGDLAEEYRSGRSAAWYWRQVLTSVVMGAGQQLWSDKWLGVQAAATCVGLQTFLAYLWRMLWYQTTLSTTVQAFTESLWGPPDPLVNAPYLWILTASFIPVPLLTGWVLAKLHQRQRGAVAITCCLLVTAMTLPRLAQLSTMALNAPDRAMNLYVHLAMIAVLNLGLLFGVCMRELTERPVVPRAIE